MHMDDQSSDGSKLLLDYSRLQLKLRAQEAVCQKLMREKSHAVQSCEGYEKKLRLLQHEFDMREKMFLRVREELEKEIASLKCIKQDLEVRLLTALDSSGEFVETLNTDDDMKFSTSGVKSTFSTLPKLSCEEAVDTLNKWEGMDPTIAVLQSAMENEFEQMKWKPGSPWISKWKFVLTVYISASFDTSAVVESFLKEFLPKVQQQCNFEGCYIDPVVMNVAEVRALLTEDLLIQYSASVVDKADLFVSILKDEADNLTKVEIERGFLNSPCAKPGMFLLLPHSNTSSVPLSEQNARRLKDRVRKLKKFENVAVCECGEDVQDGLLWLTKQISHTLKQEYGIMDLPSDTPHDLVDRLIFQSDMRNEWEQTQALFNLLILSPGSMVGVDEVFTHLEGYLNDEGPVDPLLLTGCPGSGKSTVLAKWIEELTQIEDRTVVVLHHFVQCLCSTSAEPTVMYKRFIQQMMYYCKDETSTACESPSQWEQHFISWLEKISTEMNSPQDRVVIVIDGADLITDFEQYMNWVCKPLPNRVRVLLSAREENYPETWKSLPSPSIPTPTRTDLREIIKSISDSTVPSKELGEEHVGLLAISAPETPLLWCVLATKHLLRCTYMSCDEIDELIEELEEYQEVLDLVGYLLNSLDKQYPALAGGYEKILKLIYCSRDGLLLSEITRVMNMSPGMVYCLLYELQCRGVVSTIIGGRYSITNEHIQEGILVKYTGTPACDHLQSWTSPLLNFFSDCLNEKTMFVRCVVELPWLLKRAELSQELLKVILDIDFLIYIFSSGRTAELLRYWSHFQKDPSLFSHEYYSILLKMEDSHSVTELEMATLFKIVGKILMQLGFLDQALKLLQRALELCETFLDPDSKELGSTMYELASLHFSAGRFSTAEVLYKDSLDTLETCCDEDSPLVLKVLEYLARMYKKWGKNDMSHGVYTRILSIKDKSEHPSTETSQLLQKRAEELEELCSSSSFSKKLAGFLNELGVILTVYGDNDIGEEKFLQSLRLFETVAPGDIGVLTILKNLGRFYLQKNRLDLAIPLCENVYEFTIQNFSARHPEVVLATEKLALLHREQGNLLRAESLQRELLHLKTEQFGEYHLEVAKVLNNLAVLCCLKGEYALGVPYYDQAIAIYGDKLGVKHAITLAAINNKQLALNNVL